MFRVQVFSNRMRGRRAMIARAQSPRGVSDTLHSSDLRLGVSHHQRDSRMPPEVGGTRSFRAQAVLDALRLSGGSIGGSTEVARRLGLADRFALTRLLRSGGLLPLNDLARWTKVLTWVRRWEKVRIPLYVQAMDDGKEPASYYRTVVRATGLVWSEARKLGSHALETRFLELCRSATTS